MSIELLPFSAFALESCAAPAPTPGEGQTLTLALRCGRGSSIEPMVGLLTLRAASAAVQGSHHAGVVAPAEGGALAITF